MPLNEVKFDGVFSQRLSKLKTCILLFFIMVSMGLSWIMMTGRNRPKASQENKITHFRSENRDHILAPWSIFRFKIKTLDNLEMMYNCHTFALSFFDTNYTMPCAGIMRPRNVSHRQCAMIPHYPTMLF